MKLSLNIVGLTHNDIKENYIEYARTAGGKIFKLVPDLQNVFDPMAVKAYDGRLFLGYVAAQDLEDVKALIIASGKKMLRAVCTGYHAKEDGESGLYLSAVASVEVDEKTLGQAYDAVYDDSVYEGWRYSGPVIAIDRLARIDDCTVMLEDDLAELKEALDDEPDSVQGNEPAEIVLLEKEAESYLADFLENHCFDYSREMMRTRKRIQGLLERVGKGRFRIQRETLLSEMGYLTSSGYREEAAHVFFVDTPIELLKRKTGNYDYTDRLNEVERELEAFPFDLYRKFKADPVDFLREVFYKRVPRREMKKLLSGIIFMVMNRRVSDVKRWGKNDDRIALQEMKELRHIKVCQVVMSDEEKAERAKLCIRKMAVEPAKSGYGWMIKSQADWYVVQRVLVDAELIDIRDHARFSEYLSKVMEEGDAAVSEGMEPSDGKASSDGKVSSNDNEPSGAKARPRIPLCKKKDLDQASVEVFEKTSPKEWAHLSDDELGGVQQAKFNHYCDIVEAMLRLL